MKKISIWLLCTLLFITSCAPQVKEDEVVQDDDTAKQERSIVPSYQLSKEKYKMILPYRVSKARGVIVNQIANRLDIDEMEQGLRRHAIDYFDPEKYYFEEGQYLTEDMVYDWLGRFPTEKQLKEQVQERVKKIEKDTERKVSEAKVEAIKKELQQGLNPPVEDDQDEDQLRESPRYLSHILEQNFLIRKDENTVELQGIAIGIAMKSVYRFETKKAGPYYEDISKSKMLEQGYKVADKILQRVRKIEGLKDVPIMFALYREQEQAYPVPGNFVARAGVSGGETSIDKWEAIDEEYMLFPSSEAKEKYFDDHQLVKSFGDEISQYFPNYVGVIGEGFYINEELQKLTLEIPIEFYGKAEVVGFTQYAYGLVKEMFKDYYDLEINVQSSDKMESFIYRKAGQKEPSVHIFD